MDSNETKREAGKHAGFAINPDARITSTKEAILDGATRCQSARELGKLAEGWPSSRLVQVWNQLPGVKPVKKFTDRKTAVSRIWKAIEGHYGVTPISQPATRRGVGNSQTPSVGETKADEILLLLKQPFGCSLKMLMNATGWQAHTVRSFLSRHIRKKLGLRIKSFRRDGERVYAVRSNRI